MRRLLLAAMILAMPVSAWAQACQKSSVGADLPNGQMARGINIYADELFQYGAQAVSRTFPNINFLRINIFDLKKYSAPVLAPVVNQLTGAGITVELEDHNYPTVLTGDDLKRAAKWYASLAYAFKDNPGVVFGTQNEPDLSSGAGAVDNEIVTIYKAIRDSGNNTLVLLNPAGGFSVNGLNPRSYSDMKNVAWDLHFYNWMAKNSTDVGANYKALMKEVEAARSLVSLPVIIGEYGNSSGADGAVYDKGGMQVVQAVQQSGIGSAAWAWTSGNPTLPLLLKDPYGNPNAGLTPFGELTRQFIRRASPPGQPLPC